MGIEIHGKSGGGGLAVAGSRNLVHLFLGDEPAAGDTVQVLDVVYEFVVTEGDESSGHVPVVLTGDQGATALALMVAVRENPPAGITSLPADVINFVHGEVPGLVVLMTSANGFIHSVDLQVIATLSNAYELDSAGFGNANDGSAGPAIGLLHATNGVRAGAVAAGMCVIAVDGYVNRQPFVQILDNGGNLRLFDARVQVLTTWDVATGNIALGSFVLVSNNDSLLALGESDTIVVMGVLDNGDFS